MRGTSQSCAIGAVKSVVKVASAIHSDNMHKRQSHSYLHSNKCSIDETLGKGFEI